MLHPGFARQPRPAMVAGTTRMSVATVKKQAVNQQKRKCTRADPAQTRVLLNNYDAEARPSTEQLADMSRETNLPVDWIKKWFLRKRKADGKNKILTPAEPTFVENDPPVHDSQALGHAHSKFWNMDAFAAADSTSFSPSVGHIPKLYGHRRRGLLFGIAGNDDTNSQGNEGEKTILPPGTSAETGYSYASPSDSALTVENAGCTAPARYDLREILLGTDAFAGYVSVSTDEDAPKLNTTLIVDELLSVVSSSERSVYPDNPFHQMLTHSDNVTDSEITVKNYPVGSVSPSADVTDGFFSTSKDLDLITPASCSTSDGSELSAFDWATGCSDLDLGSLAGFANDPSYMTNVLDEPSPFYESLFFQGKQDPAVASIDVNDRGSHLAQMGVEHEFESASALGLSLLNCYDDMCDPTASMTDFGGFDGSGNDDDVDGEGVDSDEGWWVDGAEFEARIWAGGF